MRAHYATSTATNTADAVRDTVGRCREALGAPPVAGMLFAGADHQPDVIAKIVGEMLPNTPLIGCSTDGEITSDGVSMDSVTLMLIASENVTAKAVAIDDLGSDSLEAGRRLAQATQGPHARVLVMLPDGLTGNGAALIRGAQEILGESFVIAGGTAGDRGRFKQTWQVAGGRAYSNAVAGLMFYSAAPLRVGQGMMSGWRPIGISKTVTKAAGNVVYTIDGQSALEVYQSYLGDKASQLPAIGVEYPFGMVDDAAKINVAGLREGEEYILLRAPMGVDAVTGAVTFAAEIPQGTKVKMTRAKSSDVVDGARQAARHTMADMPTKPEVVFFFSCMARKMVLGRRTKDEIVAAQEVFGPDVPMAGFYSYGEIANCGRERSMCRFHNETATFLALSEA